MKGWVLNSIGNIEYKETEKPAIKEDEVIVKVKAAGICGSDIPRIYKSGAHNMPLIPGHEFSGVVLNEKEFDKLYGSIPSSQEQIKWSGKRVGIFPLIPCKKCSSCLQQKYEMCKKYNYLGSRCDGGYAQYVAVPVWNLIKLPDNVSYEAAAMLEPMAVSVHAIRQFIKGAEDINGKSIMICGLGTIGQMLLSFIIDMTGSSDNIYAIGNKAFQKEIAVKIGLPEDHFFEIGDNLEANIRATNPDGFDYYFECVGKNQTVKQGIELTCPGGSLQLVGNPASDMCFDQDTYWKILRKQLTVKGTWNSSFTHSEEDDWHYVLNCLNEGRIKPDLFITHRFIRSDLEKGFIIMRDKSEEYIKIMGISEE